MPIELPNLDDRSFADLVEEGKRLIPGFAPAWTDHNASDPGITFVELFASVAEMLMYRVNRISEPSKRAFVQLLAPDSTPTPGWTVDQEISAAVKALRVEERAVTASDFERLALQVPDVARAHCLPRRNLAARENAASTEALGHVSLIVICRQGLDLAAESAELVIRRVQKHLRDRCLIASQLHVVLPARLTVAVNLTLRIHPDQLKEVVDQRALAALQVFFDPLSGGTDGKGWPVGAPIYRSQIYALMDQVEGVDYVDLSQATDDLFVVGSPAKSRQIDANGSSRNLAAESYVGLRLEANEALAFSSAASTIDSQSTKTNLPS
jgi:baseplate J-like protein